MQPLPDWRSRGKKSLGGENGAQQVGAGDLGRWRSGYGAFTGVYQLSGVCRCLVGQCSIGCYQTFQLVRGGAVQKDFIGTGGAVFP